MTNGVDRSPKIEIKTSSGDLERGLDGSASKRELLQDLSKIADNSRDLNGQVKDHARAGLLDWVRRIVERG